MLGEARGGTTVQDWEAPAILPSGWPRPLAFLAVPLLVIAVALAVFTQPLFGAAVLLAGVLIVALVLVTAGGRVLKVLDARPAEDGSRVANLVTGLATDMGMDAPRVWVVSDERPNALAVWHRGPNVGVTSGLLSRFTRTETEAALAHCLVRLRDERRVPTLLIALGSIGIASPGAKMGYTDVKAVAVTRYPPGLASALEKSFPRAGKDSLLWMVADDVGQGAVAARAEALRDL